jgi:hypothetical protein
LTRHLIPADPALWKLDRFEDFITARKELILAKMRDLKLIVPETGLLPVPKAPTPSGAFTTIPSAE